MRFKISIIIIFISLAIQAQHYKTSYFNNKNTFTDAFVYSIVQDNSGYLWIGTSNGLYKYNGFSFQSYTQEDSLASDFITSSYNHNGSIWFGHRSGWLSLYHNDSFEKIAPPKEDFSSIVQFQTDSKGQLWAASYLHGMLRVNNKNEVERYVLLEEDLTIHAFKFVDDNRIVLGSDDGVRICRINSDCTISIVKHLVDIPKVKVSAIEEYKPFVFIIGTEGSGVFELKINESNVETNRLFTCEEINESVISSLYIDKQSGLWIGTFGKGVIRHQLADIEQDGVSTRQIYSSKTSNYIKYIYQDRDENIWLGNYGSGLTKISKNPFHMESVSYAGVESSILAIATNDSLRWVGINGAILCYNNSNSLIKTYTSNNGLPNDEISSLFAMSNGTLFAGTPNSGLYKLNSEASEFIQVKLSSGRLENSITTLAGNNQYVIAGTKKGLVQIEISTGKTIWYSIHKGGLPHNVVKDIYIDLDDKIWVTTQSNILSYIENGQMHKIDIPSSVGMFSLNTATKDDEGNIWLGSNGMGVYKIMGDLVINLREKEGLFSNYCYSIKSDNTGFVWVSHRGGLSRIDAKSLAIRAIQKYAGIDDNDEFNPNASSLDSDGVLWFGSINGLLSYNPNLENQQFLPPKLNLSSLKINGIEYATDNKITLSSGLYKLKFEFIGISLREPEDVKYQYRLMGYDEEWSEISKEQTAAFTNLSSGHYTFELNSSSSDGVVTTSPLIIKIIIKKPFWSYWWFYVLVFSAIFGVIVSYMRRRERKFVQDKANLEQRVKERTREIQLQNDEIQRQGEIINRKNIDITDSIRYSRSIQSAIFPPEDILKSALPEYFLINKPKDIVSGDFCWYTRYKDKYVIAVTDCTGHGVPGAIMSMLGITLFNEVVNNLGITNSAEILEVVRDKVISALNQHRKENPAYDGMNVGLCVIDKSKKYIQYSGAFHNLVHFHKNELSIIKAERTPIGYSLLGKPKFITHNVEYAPGDMFYMYSDGYTDQFGGENDRKFTNRRLLDVFSDMQDKPMDKQKLIVEKTLLDWMQEEEQTDDIVLLGFRL